MEKNLAIIIPAFNEEANIALTVEKCLPFAPTVIVANDGSEDNTSTVARAAGAFVLDLPHRGCGGAVSTAFRWALKEDFACVVTLDADLAYDPREISAALEKHRRNSADLTIGSRFQDTTKIGLVPSPKLWANHFARSLVNCVCDHKMSDVACGLRVLGPRAMGLPYELPGFGIAYEQIILAAQAGLYIQQLPVSVHYDAREPLCTSRTEILDLLYACVKWSRNAELNGTLACMIEMIKMRKSRIAVSLYHARSLKEKLYLHFIEALDSYIFQAQDTYLLLLYAEEEDVAIISSSDRQ